MATELGHRVAYQQALGAGLGVTTFDPDSHAAGEVRALADEIRNMLRATEVAAQPAAAPWRFADFKAFTEYERKTVYEPLHTF